VRFVDRRTARIVLQAKHGAGARHCRAGSSG
jgi:hypothetical protein